MRRRFALVVAALMVGSLVVSTQVGPARAFTPVDAGSTTPITAPDNIRHNYLSPSNCLPDCDIWPEPGFDFDMWRMQLVAGVPVALSATKLARGTLFKAFTYTGDNPVWARVTGFASWAGELSLISGVWNAEAGIEINAQIVDLRNGVWDAGDPVVAQQLVHSSVCSGDIPGPGACVTTDVGEAQVDLRFPLEPNHSYELQYVASAWGKVSGVGVAVASNFFGDQLTPVLYPGVYLENVIMTVDRDLQDQIDELSGKVDELTTKVDDLTTLVEVLRDEYDAHHHAYLTGPGSGQNNTQADTSLPAAPGQVSTAPLDPKLVPPPKP